jgi:hypothetical protein
MVTGHTTAVAIPRRPAVAECGHLLFCGVGRSRSLGRRRLTLESPVALEAPLTLEAPLARRAIAEAWSAVTIAWPAVTRLASTFGEGKQRQVPRALDRCRQRALMLGTGAGLPARLDHAAVGDEPPQARDILIIDVLDAIGAKSTDLAPGKRAASPAAPHAAAGALRALRPLFSTLSGLSFVHHSGQSFQSQTVRSIVQSN